MKKKLAMISAATTLMIASAGVSTAFQKQGVNAVQTSSKMKQFEVTQVATAPSCDGEDLSKVHMTYYSYHDNDYIGNPNPNYDIAYSSDYSNLPNYKRLIYKDAKDKKGGDGSYEKPIIVAIPTRYNWQNNKCLFPGTRIYAPHLKKYLIVADECPPDKCKGKRTMIDVWMYTTPQNNIDKVMDCQKSWTHTGFDMKKWDVIINPPNNKPVDRRPFFYTKEQGSCREVPFRT
ncbi:MAG: hypothetical protein WBA07_28705 [Rivularia sp. (in: cyanobacteria)]